MKTIDINGNLHSESPEEAQAMFTELQNQVFSKDQDDDKDKKDEDKSIIQFLPG